MYPLNVIIAQRNTQLTIDFQTEVGLPTNGICRVNGDV